MSTHKILVSLDDRTYKAATAISAEEGLNISDWVIREVMHSARVQDGLRAMREWQADDLAPITAEEDAAAAAMFAELDRNVGFQCSK